MGILSWVVLGLVAGLLAKLIMPGKDPGGCIITMLLGVAGALVGGFIASFLGFGGVQSFSIYGILIATGGALVVLAIYRAIKKG